MQKIINRLKKMGLSATQIIFNLVTSGLICCTTVSGHSMMPTVHDGDRLLYNPFFINMSAVCAYKERQLKYKNSEVRKKCKKS